MLLHVDRDGRGLLIGSIVIVKVNGPMVAVSDVAIASFLWAAFVDPFPECVKLSSTALKEIEVSSTILV